MPIKTLPFHSNGHIVGPHTTVQVLDVSLTSRLENVYHLMDPLFTCAGCGTYAQTEITEDAVRVVGGPCPLADTGITTTITLPVPSGKLIVACDLRPVYDGYGGDDFAPYTSTLGIHQVIEAFAAQGCAFGFVGDNWPNLYRTGDDTYVLASPAWDDEIDDLRTPEGWTELASVSGAIWSYSLADFEDWEARGGKMVDLEDATIVDIPAGTYEFTYHGGEKGFDRHGSGTVIFTHITKVV